MLFFENYLAKLLTVKYSLATFHLNAATNPREPQRQVIAPSGSLKIDWINGELRRKRPAPLPLSRPEEDNDHAQRRGTDWELPRAQTVALSPLERSIK